MTAPARQPDVHGLTTPELHWTRRDLATAMALTPPGSPASIPITAYLHAIDTELGRRGSPGTPDSS